MNEASKVRDHLFSLENKGIKYDLDRMRIAADRCGNPQNAYKSIHVAGTNGKGSTCTYIESVLRTAGFTTGLYTSPHIINFEERFLISGVPVTEDDWLEIYIQQKAVIDELNLTFFEAITLIAFELFRRKNVDWVVFETGLGGRLDATNIIIPQVSVITGIAVDHTQYLGSALLSIAGEKLGIVKDNCPLVFAESSDKSIMELVERTSIQRNAPVHIVSSDDAMNIDDDEFGVNFLWHGLYYRVPLHGIHQVSNALCALNALQCAGVNDYETIKNGLEKAFIPGRFQIVNYMGRTIVFDVGHNPDGASAVVKTLDKKFKNLSVCFITGMMKDKDTGGILKQYGLIASHIILTKPQISRAAQPTELLNAIKSDYLHKCEICATVGESISKALKRDDDLICITGSFYTVGEAFQCLGIDPYKC